ncbi:hypothetical protein Neosp_004146 [[Neocosmospora] mangrovei]
MPSPCFIHYLTAKSFRTRLEPHHISYPADILHRLQVWHLPQNQKLIHAIDDDHDVVLTRQAGRALRSPSQLKMNEKLLLADLLIQFTSMRKHLPQERVHSDAVLYNQFLREVFRNGSSVTKSNPKPIWRDPKFKETSIESQAAMSAARAAGAPAMLGLTLNLEEGSYAFLWRDSNCKFINPKYVQLSNEYTMATARAAAIEHYDGRAVERIVTFNTSLVVSAARRRIQKWAVSGSQAQAGIDNANMVTAGEVLKLVLATDFLAEGQVALQETMQEFSERDLVPAQVLIYDIVAALRCCPRHAEDAKHSPDSYQRTLFVL